MKRQFRHLAAWLLKAASRLLPARSADWGRAMERELAEIHHDRAALSFAAGCVRAILTLALAERVTAARSCVSKIFIKPKPSEGTFEMISQLPSPRASGLICGTVAVGLGAIYLMMAGAPGRYIFVNLASLVLGATAWLALRPTKGARLAGAGIVICACALALSLTALTGQAIDGAARWIDLGPLTLQISLILVPPMLIVYARQPDLIGTIGMVAAAGALALQPDRAMAGVLLAGLLAIATARPRPLQIAAAAAAVLAFGSTLLAPDMLPAVPYVDRVLYSAFDIGLLTGGAVVLGAAFLLLPAALALVTGSGDRALLLVFGACWAAVIVAAALGTYPTPVVGYGGSAILGYLLSVGLLPDRASRASYGKSRAALTGDADGDQHHAELRGAKLA